MQEQLEEPIPPLILQFSSSEEDEKQEDLYQKLSHIRSKNKIQELFSIQIPDKSHRKDLTVQQRTKIIDDWYWLITKQANALKQKQQEIEQFHIQTSISELEKPAIQTRQVVINEGNSEESLKDVGLSTLDKKTFTNQYSVQQINPFFSQTIKQFDQQDLTSLLLYRPKYDDEMSIVVDPNQFNKQELLELPQIHQGYIKIEIDTSPFDYCSYNSNEIINLSNLKNIRDRFIFLTNDKLVPQKQINPLLQEFKDFLQQQNVQQMEIEQPKQVELSFQIPAKIKIGENIQQQNIQEEIQQTVQSDYQFDIQQDQIHQEIDQNIIEDIEIQIQEQKPSQEQKAQDENIPLTYQPIEAYFGGDDQGDFEQESPQIERNTQKIHIPINFNNCHHYDRNDLEICEIDDKQPIKTFQIKHSTPHYPDIDYEIYFEYFTIPCYQSDEEKYRSSSSSSEENNQQEQINQIQELIENFNPFEQLQNFNPDNITIKQFQELIHQYLKAIQRQIKFSELFEYFNLGSIKVNRGRILVALLFVLKSQSVYIEQIDDQDFNIQIVY
ncbi:hypothetical protein pb186bvf_006120 [Paramecium bursaria]